MFASGKSASVSAVANYIEDVFSTWLYTGNSSTQTITNGIDLAGKGGLVWTKTRNAAVGHGLVDTVRGGTKLLQSNTTAAEDTFSGYITAFGATGYTLGASGVLNDTYNMVSWTFRKQPKFFTQGTYSGNGSTQAITHDLGSAPGCVIVKNITTSGSWIVWHRGLSSGYYIQLNGTGAQDNLNAARRFGNNSTTVDPTSTTITVGDLINTSGDTWVYYAFAHDAGGFGLTGTDNVISCGSYTGNGAAGGQDISLGYEPQWVLFKNTTDGGNWNIYDTMRGWIVGGNDQYLFPNTTNAESDLQNGNPTATGMLMQGNNSNNSGSGYIYIAIRRGPMKVPTLGTSVFAPTTTAGTGVVVNTNFPVDLNIYGFRSGNINSQAVNDRLRGVTTTATQASSPTIKTSSTDAENTGIATVSWGNTGFTTPTTLGVSLVHWSFSRAPGFFDEVCYTGTGGNQTVSHNLGVAPELMLVKSRSLAISWAVYAAPLGPTQSLRLDSDSTPFITPIYWNDTAPSATSFTVGSAATGNYPGDTYVAYLFATCPGVSKVGSFTGTGATQTINCGFTGGARFVMIKRTDSTGDWYVWDTARGIVSGNDPRLSLNTTAAEVTTDDSVDTDSTGFVVNQLSATNINVTSATYIFLAIA